MADPTSSLDMAVDGDSLMTSKTFTIPAKQPMRFDSGKESAAPTGPASPKGEIRAFTGDVRPNRLSTDSIRSNRSSIKADAQVRDLLKPPAQAEPTTSTPTPRTSSPPREEAALRLAQVTAAPADAPAAVSQGVATSRRMSKLAAVKASAYIQACFGKKGAAVPGATPPQPATRRPSSAPFGRFTDSIPPVSLFARRLLYDSTPDNIQALLYPDKKITHPARTKPTPYQLMSADAKAVADPAEALVETPGTAASTPAPRPARIRPATAVPKSSSSAGTKPSAKASGRNARKMAMACESSAGRKHALAASADVRVSDTAVCQLEEEVRSLRERDEAAVRRLSRQEEQLAQLRQELHEARAEAHSDRSDRSTSASTPVPSPTPTQTVIVHPPAKGGAAQPVHLSMVVGNGEPASIKPQDLVALGQQALRGRKGWEKAVLDAVLFGKARPTRAEAPRRGQDHGPPAAGASSAMQHRRIFRFA